jgi:hypothetical protein
MWGFSGNDFREAPSQGNHVYKFASIVLAAVLGLAASGGVSAQTQGDWVLGDYKGSGYWFPGIAEKIEGGKITIVYDDGERETVNKSNIRPYDWMIGMKVQCNFKGQGDWYDGTIASLAGENIGIAYDDGDKETTKTGRCRSL